MNENKHFSKLKVCTSYSVGTHFTKKGLINYSQLTVHSARTLEKYLHLFTSHQQIRNGFKQILLWENTICEKDLVLQGAYSLELSHQLPALQGASIIPSFVCTPLLFPVAISGAQQERVRHPRAVHVGFVAVLEQVIKASPWGPGVWRDSRASNGPCPAILACIWHSCIWWRFLWGLNCVSPFLWKV